MNFFQRHFITNKLVRKLSKMSAKIAAVGAVVLSICTVLGCFMFIPILWQKVSSINDEIGNDVNEFNVRSYCLSFLKIIRKLNLRFWLKMLGKKLW